MNNEYEQVVKIVCGEEWDSAENSADDRDGAIGVAIMLAYLQGIPPRLNDLANALDLPPYLLEMSYKRLQINGLFSPRSWVLKDLILRGRKGSDYDHKVAWCHIAGLSSGYTGKGFTREEYASMYGKE